MKKIAILTSVVALILGALVVKTQMGKKESSLSTKESISLAPNRSPMVCSTTTDSISKISQTKGEVSNSNYLKYQRAEFASGKKVDIITSNDQPYQVGQVFMVALDCTALKEGQTIPVRERLPDTKDPQTGAIITNLEEVHKTQVEVAGKDDCINIYLLNQEANQLKLECVHMVDDKVYLLKKTEGASK